jgi:hypothetical protein
MPAPAADHLEAKFADLKADRSAAEIFIRGIANSNSVYGKP